MFRIKEKIESRRLLKSIPRDLKNIISSISAGEIVIDLGANIGSATNIFQGYGAKVYAIEPNPFAFKRLSNRFAGKMDIFPIHAAASVDESSFVPLYLHSKSKISPVKFSTGSSLMSNKPNIDSNDWIKVPSMNLVTFIQELGKIKILKMDVEGYETELIPAMIESEIIEAIEFVFIETHERKWPELMAATLHMKNLVVSSRYKNKFYFNWP